MKKNIKKLIVVLAVFTMVLAFTSCGGKDMSGSPYLGTWKAVGAEYSGISVDVESVLGGEFVVELKDDGSCTVNAMGNEESGKWSETDKGFNVEDEFDFSVNGNTATMEYDGVSISFEKQQ